MRTRMNFFVSITPIVVTWFRRHDRFTPVHLWPEVCGERGRSRASAQPARSRPLWLGAQVPRTANSFQ